MCKPFLAYLDPGAGSILLQCLAGVLVGAGIFYHRSLTCLLRFLRRGDKIGTSDAPPSHG